MVKGWRLSGITRFSSGLPVTLVETDDAFLLGTSGAVAISLPIDTPNFTPGSLKIGDPHSTTVPYFNTSLFSVEATGTLGNARRRFFSGPRSNNWDVALLKDTLIKEGVNLEFRAELFNAFNHAQLVSQMATLATRSKLTRILDTSPDLGMVNSANPPRIMQLSLKLLF